MSMFEKPIPKKPLVWVEGSVRRFRAVSTHMAALVEELGMVPDGHSRMSEVIFGTSFRSLRDTFAEIKRRADEAAKLWGKEEDLAPLVDQIVNLVEGSKLTCAEMQKVQREVVERCG